MGRWRHVDYLTPRLVYTRRAVVWIAAVLAFGAAALIAELTDNAQPLAVLRSSGSSIAIFLIALLITPVTGTTAAISLAIAAISGVWWAAYKQPYLAAD